MEKSFNRSIRISQELQKNIAFIVQYSLKDPRIKTLITISEVRLSRDLSYAQVFVSFLEINDQFNINKKLSILNNSTGYIRKLLCTSMRLRIIPRIVFFYDESLLKGHHISKILLHSLKDKNSMAV